jgi:cobaltochelatase CobT
MGTWLRAIASRKSEKKDHTGYRVYTAEFDAVVRPDQLDDVIGPLTKTQKSELAVAWEAYENGTAAWRTAAEISALEAAERVRSAVAKTDLRDTAVTILVDHSGSMRGQKILLAAVAVDVVQYLLASLDVRTEILGFTTRSWKGGRSRKIWRLSGKPHMPGRLCDLLHIIYSPFGNAAAGRSHRVFATMLRPDLLKENVDGEAIQWAVGRLTARPETRKILIMISDGAPVDDSTLSANGPDYLYSHYKAVIAETTKKVCLAMLIIGEELPVLFERQRSILTPSDLGTQLIYLAEETITAERQTPAMN